MAGAGPVSQKLPSIVVPQLLSEGGRFLKWDESDANCTFHIVEVDPKGHVLSWKPEDYSKDTEVLELVHVRDVRTGQYARTPKAQATKEAIKGFCAFDNEASAIQERTVTVVYGPNMVDLTFVNFVTSSISEAGVWAKHLFRCTNNLLEDNASPLKCLERFFTKIYVQKNQDGEIPAKLLVKHFATGKDDKKRAYDMMSNAGLAQGKRDFIKVKDFTFERFLTFYNSLVTRKDLDVIFTDLGAKRKPYLTADQLVDFLNSHQRDPRLNEILFPYYNSQRANGIIQRYELNKDFANKGFISIQGLTSFLMSEDNSILLPEKLQIHQEMTFPMAHYFINSSHNTYLTGHQLTGKSSVEIYRQVLLSGCRCIELDCWDGKGEDLEPVITHGMTLCTEVPFKDVLEAIAESAFKTTDYPVVLSFENHCSAKQQKKMANYCLLIFGDMLLNKSIEDFPLEKDVELPSPKDLKNKILIKNKKRVIKETKSQASVELTGQQSVDSGNVSIPLDTTIPEEPTENDGNDGEPEVEVVQKSEEEEQEEVEAQQELSELVNYFQPVHFRGFDKAEKFRKCYEMSSFSENAAMNLLKESPVEFVNYNKFQPSRIYPKGQRISSDNYNPQMFWNAGCQFVALNFQTLDVPMMLNLGKFETNGRCGYLLKPEHMRRKDRTFDPFVDSMVDGVIAGTVHVKVISGQCLSERRCGAYVDVEMFGLPADIVRKQYRTKVVQNNTVNPVFDEEPFKFKVIMPHLAVLRICVYEDNGKLIGHRILPIDGLSPGFRHIKLRNESYQPLCLPTLFVEIVTKDYVPESLNDFANALTNPQKYLSEKEQRAKKLEALMEEGDQEGGTEGGKVNGNNKPTGMINKDGAAEKKEKTSVMKETIHESASVPTRVGSMPPRKVEDQVKETTKRSISQGNIKPTEEIIIKADLNSLLSHKIYLKLNSKHNAEMNSLVSKHIKELGKVNKEIDLESKRRRSIIEKEKSTTQKRYNKLLKKAEKEGTYTEVYNECLKEIGELNDKQDRSVEEVVKSHRSKLKEMFQIYYEEQLSLAKSQVQPKIDELRKTLKVVEASDKKKLISQHSRDMATLKNAQDLDRSNRMKDLSKGFKDPEELAQHRRRENKKHVEQSVKERQKLQSHQETELETLTKEYEDLSVSFDEKHSKDVADLESLFRDKVKLLDTQDLRTLTPKLLSADCTIGGGSG
ncbi:1-phosphatidylinositol 4,5-bisphosphate phosphodiesterase beta-4-like isoform X2 [Clytia hemisphaerica]|uniref:1-phosphatidylinositol 4,5-bisphosphate phosphodiesterase n=1 Tax=Clytia hemisphaerica TaxID=252671 RepID=A0A7M5TUT8_9CNID